MKDAASNVISDQWYKERKQDIEEEKRRIIAAAASLIRSEVRKAKYPLDVYPSQCDSERKASSHLHYST